ncbi:MAG: tRNA pseudouridine(55) synthase TruB [Cellvibrionaceae bacterium]|nr:tRNA pseudouridine(55) synthase TruB [Cellvibrionaceae bacterium]
MGRKRNFGRPISGVLVLNKAAGMTSNQALQKAKHLFFANKAGHTGSLDPFATGVLPLCFGEATKFSQYLLDADKRYISTFRLGIETSTADIEGEEIARADASHISVAQIEAALTEFRGDILQIPPMVSALKVNGQPLYKLARKGQVIERQARAVTIHQLDVLAVRPGVIAEVDVDIRCSKGTYIRSIASDLGAKLGVGGHVAKLHRAAAGMFVESQSVTLEALMAELGDGEASSLDHHLLPPDAALDSMPKLALSDTSSHYFCQGQAVMDMRVYRLGDQGDTVRVCREDGVFIGLGEITDDGCVAPRRVVVLNP